MSDDQFDTLKNLKLGSDPKDLPARFFATAQHGLNVREARYHLAAGVVALLAVQSDAWTRKLFAKASGAAPITVSIYTQIGKAAQRVWEHQDILPGDLSALCTLCRMPPRVFQDYLEAGAIHPGLSAIEIEEHPVGRSYFGPEDDDD